MKYILNSLSNEKSRITYEQQNENKGNDSHNYILEEITNRVGNSRDKRYINQEFRALKQERVSSDYEGITIEADRSTDIKQLTESLIYKLKNSFGNP